MSKHLFIGRYQPFHDGHRALIDIVLKEGGRVVVGVMDTPVSEKNPYNLAERIKRIQKIYDNNPSVEIISLPHIKEICYGRDVGYGIRRIRLPKQTEEISATKIRNSKKKIIWLTGNTGAGKTSLAYLLKERLNGIVLDGDEMRASISIDLGLSDEDREENNLRIARLAAILNAQNQNVIVSVIAPFEKTRQKIDKLINPYWIYIGGGETAPDKPYEPPEKPHLTIDPAKESLLESLEKIIKEVGEIPPIAI